MHKSVMTTCYGTLFAISYLTYLNFIVLLLVLTRLILTFTQVPVYLLTAKTNAVSPVQNVQFCRKRFVRVLIQFWLLTPLVCRSLR